ncbi:MAG: 3-deoxy-manno-octulosonate cytidylyltransferase [Dysgonamonadaceae bacterium]|jgi:3-deoxy-manno-octulosonate cytidylyltransferase (CMP-KDO synthetase)|nr:3-deoxy-manno-octulosonate cytidylyltransferase [Dysgonamonadaceae bacterium]
MEKILGIIPARYASTRFPGKPLAKIDGKTLIERVYKQVYRCFETTVVATDDRRIFDEVTRFGGHAIMTSKHHQSGTDRCFEALSKTGGQYNAIVNIQGDEPFISPSQIETLKKTFDNPDFQISTLIKPFEPNVDPATLSDRNTVKVVTDLSMNAIYFSRSVIPYPRDSEQLGKNLPHITYYKHIGIYGFHPDILKAITSLPRSPLETAESLEQLRWIENGYQIKVAVTNIETIGIDTPENLQDAIRKLTRKQ